MSTQRKGMIYRSFVYFLSIYFLLCMNGFPKMVAEAKEMNPPVGEMVSRGEVRFEARQNIWEKVEPSYFPVFQGVKIKTEKGSAAIALANTGQIEVGPNSLFFFDQMDRFILSTFTDGVIFVVLGGKTPRETLQRAKDVHHQVNGKILGVVINRVNIQRSDYAYYYYRYHY